MSGFKYLVLLICLHGLLFTGHASADDTVTKQEALDLLYDWREAYLKRNYEPLNTIMDDKWLYSGSAHGKS